MFQRPFGRWTLRMAVTIESVPAEPAEQLLRAVPEEQPADDDPCDESSQLHASPRSLTFGMPGTSALTHYLRGPMSASTLPPGPRLPKWLQTAGFLFANRAWIDACRRRYGDLVTFRSLFDPRFVMVFEPELVKQVFRGSPERLRAGEANAVLGPVVGERSVLLLDGAEHMRQRKLLLPAFHGERMRAYEVVMRGAADRAIDSWPVGREFALLPSMQALTLEVISRAVFGVEEGRREELERRVRAMLDPVATRLGIVFLALSGGRIGAGRTERFEERRRRVDEL